ncbi:MAG TPA: hypothetical protein VGC73_14910 [Pyrinomonadaceae bacterium]
MKFTLVFISGLLAGAVATFIILGQMNILEHRDCVLKSASEQVFIASQLRANRDRDLQSRAEANLPGIVLTIHNDKKLRNAAAAPFVLRQVKDFYELNSIPVPAEIAGILNEIPPRNH